MSVIKGAQLGYPKENSDYRDCKIQRFIKPTGVQDGEVPPASTRKAAIFYTSLAFHLSTEPLTEGHNITLFKISSADASLISLFSDDF